MRGGASLRSEGDRGGVQRPGPPDLCRAPGIERLRWEAEARKLECWVAGHEVRAGPSGEVPMCRGSGAAGGSAVTLTAPEVSSCSVRRGLSVGAQLAGRPRPCASPGRAGGAPGGGGGGVCDGGELHTILLLCTKTSALPPCPTLAPPILPPWPLLSFLINTVIWRLHRPPSGHQADTLHLVTCYQRQQVCFGPRRVSCPGGHC